MVEVLTPPARARLQSIDVLRGLVIVIMALDHSRDFFSNSHAYFNPIDVTQTSVGFFETFALWRFSRAPPGAIGFRRA
ncbi:hypothetical protein [Candidatus Thiodictyon syntrophicum]|uniref:hypothetical protein n=1 Tax=Candidatus Thiodictyon syntrophicum TaxID=1166950 RepID=UPI001562284C|nr:hypothetical protein [Candidatus Thiodictyon syntrophicum]